MKTESSISSVACVNMYEYVSDNPCIVVLV